MTRRTTTTWLVGDLPFIWNPLAAPHNPNGLPDTLPFTLTASESTKAIMQVVTEPVSHALRVAYAMGSMITGQMDETGIGRRYAEDFLAFMGVTDREASPFKGKRVLDVGCGNGYLLHRLALQGARVLGLEPGEHGRRTFDVPVVRDFFPSSRITGRFDTIVLFGVLEHVEQPVDFLRLILEKLEPSGTVFIGVPDCAPYLDAGDLSCLIHEHWSYFDRQTLAETLRQAGGTMVHVTQSGVGGLLYASVRSLPARGKKMPKQSESVRSLEAYRARATAAVDRLLEVLNHSTQRRESVGIYVPGRIMNALFVGKRQAENLRFFDDNPLLHGTYFPGIARPIETRADLLARPTDRMLIMSRSFGREIESELRAFLPAMDIIGWRDIFHA